MIHPGLCTLTIGQCSASEVIFLCEQTGITHVEWWGREQGHVPMGNIEKAREVEKLTADSSITTASYGSYYRAGFSEDEGLSFQSVLDTCLALKAPLLRIWAGSKGSMKCSEEERQKVISDTLRIAQMCEKNGVKIVFEYHGGTLTDTTQSTIDFLQATKHNAVTSGWQPRTSIPDSENIDGLDKILNNLSTVHVFNWIDNKDGKRLRLPLNEARVIWLQYLNIVKKTGNDHVAMLEFVKDDSVEQFKEDAQTLVDFCKSIN
jgi:3-dehydroshikimate dehydratase